jgi:hypothetical protein
MTTRRFVNPRGSSRQQYRRSDEMPGYLAGLSIESFDLGSFLNTRGTSL